MNNSSLPITENPNFDEIIKDMNLDESQKESMHKFYKDGYIVIDLELDGSFIENIVNDLKKIIETNNYKTNYSTYHYNDSPRIVEAWKESENIKKLVWHKKVISTLKQIYHRNPIPFSTINFIKGTSQPMHSDNIHFDTIPPRWLTGVWVALEDVDDANGPLIVYPGSHKLKTATLNELNLPVANRENLKEVYSKYEDEVGKIILKNNLKPKALTIKKGMAIIWSANIIHGGKLIKDDKRTRQSQVTHYHYEGCEKYFNPLYSEPHNGKYKERFLDEIKILKD